MPAVPRIALHLLAVLAAVAVLAALAWLAATVIRHLIECVLLMLSLAVISP